MNFKFYLFLLVLTLSFAGCSSFNFTNNVEDPEEVELIGYKEFSNTDYIEHLMSFEKIYLDQYRNDQVEIGYQNAEYLNSIVTKIVENNELFFKKFIEPKFHIIESKIPFHFSLPGRKIFLSTSLLEKYIKNETILYCLIAYELIRSEKNIYNKSFVIPTGNISTERMLALLRISTIDKVEIHKWAFYLLKRVGIETDEYLSWLQIKNRNSLDFAIQIGDIQSISREEALFKAFLINNASNSSITRKHSGSSRSFYSFINKIKG